MYFLVIMAFAFVLSDGLPPAQFNLLAGAPRVGPLAVAVGQLLLIAVVAARGRRRTLRRLNGTDLGHEDAIESLTNTNKLVLLVLTLGLIGLMVCTPWTGLVRRAWGLGAWPLIAELVMMTPFLLGIFTAWTILYAAEIRIRREALRLDHGSPPTHGSESLHDADTSATGLVRYLVDKLRHQILIIAVPMSLIVFAKFFTDRWKPDLQRATGLVWISDSLLGCISFCVLLISPVLLRYIWATQPLPEGPLRRRFVETCQRIGLKYREILLWKTHGLAVNAAVMGFIPPLRYILVSDALLKTMNTEEVEAVFGHEAGHVHHWHLPMFGLFALLSMYVAGGMLQILWFTGWVTDLALLNLVAITVLLGCWLFGFGWLSRRFERQADLFGVRCITPEVTECVMTCPIHGEPTSRVEKGTAGLCVTAASVFGRTLLKIAELNGIPRHAPSWRHGSIDSRCALIERFVRDAAALKRFDKALLTTKGLLIVACAIGTGITAYLYYPSIMLALRNLSQRA